MLRLLIPLLIIGWICWLFLRPKKSKPRPSNPSQIESLLECAHCQTYVSSQEAFFSNGRAYCCQACLQNGDSC
ncbi:hypothetical protein HBZC1_10410 [Helicobacter bizzozeronii CIII-1]|uniref:Prokaryotic metallothionein family protein n=1 Tax=Helicobacter bizzozeronii (strain CIII-1) TaxID=1002804 RepID=F8KT76_HELBC|nr:PP0621 family protein [Helicobacter bizzozeronii]GMB93535.1 Prokaryotic metallothionein family protein [Helicobacter bizzozeronii]CCB80027.1 hypothetical protein HBZC1_10410 [Helicobacter bizzozeronii CIII-1]